MEGLKFYLVPDFHDLAYDTDGRFILGAAIYDAMSQAFFTLSLGIGALAIFGSYIGKERSLTGEAISISVLDTFVALVAGLIIFPSCFAFGVNPGQGVGLIFVTLPNVFNQMPLGGVWGGLFFLFMSFAALSTIIAVFENIVAFAMDLGWSRKKAIVVNGIALILLSLPCVLGFNVWSGFSTPVGNIQDLEDFIVSNNPAPPGQLGLSALLHLPTGLGVETIPGGGGCRERAQIPQVVESLCHVCPALHCTGDLCYGLLQKFFQWKNRRTADAVRPVCAAAGGSAAGAFCSLKTRELGKKPSISVKASALSVGAKSITVMR